MLSRRTFLTGAAAVLGAVGCGDGGKHEALRLQARPGGYDVAVYGATVAGIAAALEINRLGGRAVLVAESEHLGGTTTAGLTATDIKRPDQVGGIAREFYRAIFDHYRSGAAFRSETRSEYVERLGDRVFGGFDDELGMQWVFESHAAESVLREMLDEAGVDVVTGGAIGRAEVRSERIRSFSDTAGRQFSAQVFVDASYGGDLLHAAGVTNTVGRESIEAYGESLAGFRPGEHLGVDASTVPFVDMVGGRVSGGGDGLVQAYCYRLTLTDDPANRLVIAQPDQYDPAMFEWVAVLLQGSGAPALGDLMTFTPMPNRKTDTNGLDLVGGSHVWPTANATTRAEVEQFHRSYSLGMLWFLANDERVPAEMRREMRRWGLAADEFEAYGGFPPQMYVREARRMVSDYVMTEANCRSERTASSPVGMGSYAMDCHVVSHLADRGTVREEGAFYESGFAPYPIDYGAIRPAWSECSNLLVPVCVSASHVAYGSMRMEPVYMVLGQSAAVAAALAIDEGQDVQSIDWDRLRGLLEERGQILG